MLNVIVKQNGKAYIIFADIISALFAQKSLNGHYVSDIDVRLYVSWCHSIDDNDGIQPNYIEEISKTPPMNLPANLWNKENHDVGTRSFPNMPPGLQV